MKFSVQTKELSVTLPDRSIYGKAFLPEEAGEKLKAVILSHGYNSSHADLADLAHALAETGVFAYCYDFCGGSLRSKSSGSTLDMSIASEISDLKAVINYVKGLEYADTHSIYLYGESQGGFVSALTADDTIKGMYLLYPAFCIPDHWKTTEEQGIDGSVDFMGMPLSNRFCEGLPRYDVFEHISRYNGRVRIYQGTADKLVPMHYAQKAADSFKNAQLTVFDNEVHGFSTSARQSMIKMICDDLIALD